MIYTAKKDKHRYSPFWKYLLSYISPSAEEQFFYKIKMSKECWYDEKLRQTDHTNKICGVQLGTKKHWNTVRIGWRPIMRKGNEIFKLYVYYYSNGIRNMVELCNLYPNQQVDISLWIDDLPIVAALEDKDYEFCVNVQAKVGRYVSERSVLFRDKKPMFVWQHNPYFGGKPTAYKEHTIDLIRE